MKMLLVGLFLLSTAQAVTISIVGPCDKKPIISQDFGNKYETVGDLSLHFLTKNNIPFTGNEHSINSIYNTPTGDEALEVLSDSEMRAYGWCYSVDNKVSYVFADEFPLTDKIKKVEWIFVFAHYKEGKWLSMCTPAYTVKPAFLCQK